MIDDRLKDEILGSILMDGVSSEENKHKTNILNPDSEYLISRANGRAVIRKTLLSHFTLLLKQNLAVNPLEIRCCVCGRIVTYPVWYMVEDRTYHTIHYYVCYTGSNKAEVHLIK